jgi:hypothetical protein
MAPRVETCRSCGAAVVWLTTTKGTRMIVNADTVWPGDQLFAPKLGHRAHWADCPQREHWHQTRR